jgi:hypothetical protein
METKTTIVDREIEVAVISSEVVGCNYNDSDDTEDS